MLLDVFFKTFYTKDFTGRQSDPASDSWDWEILLVGVHTPERSGKTGPRIFAALRPG